MSASRDKTQKIAFVYSNLYQLYRKGKEAAKAAPGIEEAAHVKPEGTLSGKVIKAEDLHKTTFAAIQVREFKPIEMLGARIEAKPRKMNLMEPSIDPLVVVTQPKRAPKPEALQRQDTQTQALSSLKDNLKALNDLHSRLKFMLQELEALVKE